MDAENPYHRRRTLTASQERLIYKIEQLRGWASIAAYCVAMALLALVANQVTSPHNEAYRNGAILGVAAGLAVWWGLRYGIRLLGGDWRAMARQCDAEEAFRKSLR
jgi:hypothetical protein